MITTPVTTIPRDGAVGALTDAIHGRGDYIIPWHFAENDRLADFLARVETWVLYVDNASDTVLSRLRPCPRSWSTSV